MVSDFLSVCLYNLSSFKKVREKTFPNIIVIDINHQNPIEEYRDKVEKKDLFKLIEEVKNKIGKELLSDEELLLLTAIEISRTYTYEEKKNSL